MEIKTIDDGLKALNQFQTDYNEALKKGEEKSAELETKLDKMAADITKAIDKSNEIAAMQNAAVEQKSKDFDQQNWEKKFTKL